MWPHGSLVAKSSGFPKIAFPGWTSVRLLPAVGQTRFRAESQILAFADHLVQGSASFLILDPKVCEDVA